MPLIVYGLNHKTASLDIREQVAFAPEKTPLALQKLFQSNAANEVMILSTCNRTEIYSHAEHPEALAEWLRQHALLSQAAATDSWYCYQDQQMVRHVMRVASGLDSMVVGEAQILGQMKNAFELARQAGTIGGRLERLFQTVFAVTKQVRTETGVGMSPVSVVYSAVTLAKHIFTDLSKCNVLLIGAGQTIELAAMHLANCGVKRIIIANRSLSKAQQLADKFYGHGIVLADIPLYLAQTDIVITATASQLPVLGKGSVERALKARKHRPMFMVDLAVPRDIEPEIKNLADVYLYDLDDLQALIKENLKSRQEAAKQAEEIIEIQAKYFMRELQALNAVDTICAYREKLDQLRDQELTKALDLLQRGEAPQIVLTEMARTLTNKILHMPSTQLRQAAFDGQLELLLLARRLFDL